MATLTHSYALHPSTHNKKKIIIITHHKKEIQIEWRDQWCGESEIGKELERSIPVGPAGAYIGNDIKPPNKECLIF